MSDKIQFDQNKDHIGGSFDWEVPPNCCHLLSAAIEDDKFLFVSNFVSSEGGPNIVYMMPVDSDGALVRSDGIPVTHCPWCGAKIECRKNYSD